MVRSEDGTHPTSSIAEKPAEARLKGIDFKRLRSTSWKLVADADAG
jgi:hypothetical protein